MKRAMITGITGQDGSYLAELLLSKGYEVHGIIRRASTFNTSRIDHIYQDPNQPGTKLFLHHGDLSSTEWLLNLIYSLAPDEVYHLAAQSHVKVSFEVREGQIWKITEHMIDSSKPSQDLVEYAAYMAGKKRPRGKQKQKELPLSPK